jgi:hypothetical protein
MVPGAAGGWVRREFWRRVRIWSALALAAGVLAVAVSGRWWAFPLAAALPFLVGPLRRDLLGEVVPWFRKGEGEDEVRAVIRSLVPHGYRSLDGVAVVGGRLDHVLVGPTGVFALATKALAGTVDPRTARRPRARRELSGALDQAQSRASELRRRLERAELHPLVEAVVVVTAGRLKRGPVLMKEVAVLPTTDLRSFILSRRSAVPPADVPRIVAAVHRGDAPVTVRSISYEEFPETG